MRAKEILRMFILSRCDPLVKKRKHFNVWRRKARLLQLLEYSKVIQAFCRTNLGTHGIRRVVNNWRNLSRKLYYKTRVKLLRMRPKTKVSKKVYRKKKLYELLRITKLTTLFSRRRFIHFIILVWNIYAKNIHRKRVNMKYLYENLLKTYMNLANDIFGNNQIENPSVQDAMYEAVNTNKFITLWPDDVPLAKKHYEEMRKIKSVDPKGNTIFKSSTTTRYEVEKKGYEKKYYMGKVSEDTSEVDNEEIRLANQRRKQTFLERYRKNKSYNRDTDKRSNISYTDDKSDDKSSSYMGKGSYSKYGSKYESKYDKSKDPRKSQDVKYIVNKYVKTEGNTSTKNINNVNLKDTKTTGSGFTSKYVYTSKDKNKPDEKEKEKTYLYKKITNNGQYKPQVGNNVNVIYSSNIIKGTISSANSDNINKYESKYTKIGSQKDNKDSKNININIKTTTGTSYSKPNAYDTYQKKVYVKTTSEEPKTYSRKVETKSVTSTTGNVKSYNYSFNKDDGNNKFKYGSRDDIKYNKSGAGTQLHKSNTESKLSFAYKSQYNKSGSTSTNKDGGNNIGSKIETKIYEKKVDSQPYRSNVGSSQDSKKVTTVTKSYTSTRYHK